MWQSDQRLAARAAARYSDDERKAFRAGYSDGYCRYAMWSGNERNWYPNAYSAGYHEGASDRDETDKNSSPIA